MTESNIFESRTAGYDSAGGFCDPVLLKTTSLARLYRVSKAGKYFIIKTTKDNSGAELAMLRREYELSIGCDHPHILHIYTFEEDTPVGAGIVMEYVEGRTMTEWLAENPARESRRRIFGELLSAVGYLHKRGVLHNDLKPDNILITRTDDTLKIIDFGLSDNDAHYLARTLGCTPRYASPELRERGVLDARSDIYSVGVIMGELLGRSAGRIAARCTRPNREERYADIGQLQRAWNNRNRGWRVALWIASMAVLLLPTVLLLHEYGRREALEQASGETVRRIEERYRTMADSVEQARLEAEWREAERIRTTDMVEREAARLFRQAADSVSACHYRSFAGRHINNYYAAMTRLSTVRIAEIEDAELRATAHSRYLQIYESDVMKISRLSEALPVYPSDMPYEEIRFYDSLVLAGLPYRPYHPNR